MSDLSKRSRTLAISPSRAATLASHSAAAASAAASASRSSATRVRGRRLGRPLAARLDLAARLGRNLGVDLRRRLLEITPVGGKARRLEQQTLRVDADPFCLADACSAARARRGIGALAVAPRQQRQQRRALLDSSRSHASARFSSWRNAASACEPRHRVVEPPPAGAQLVLHCLGALEVLGVGGILLRGLGASQPLAAPHDFRYRRGASDSS